jgi:4-diphosphocytidyl-2C-methyl-D-erythritol kinase
VTLALPARAKLNLDLEVVRRTDDGYHEIRSTFQAVELHDWIEVERADDNELTATGLQFDTTASSIDKAQRALENAAGRPLPAHIHVHKRIPPGSGMGGASSDAAATLSALSRVYPLAGIDLDHIALEVGSDVPFFLHGGTARVEGRGERVTALPAGEGGWFAIAWPGIELSTRAVYEAWDDVGGTDLHRAAEHVAPQLKDFAETLGDGWRMTGSGSAFFKRTSSEEEGRKAIAHLDCWTAVAHAVGAW